MCASIAITNPPSPYGRGYLSYAVRVRAAICQRWCSRACKEGTTQEQRKDNPPYVLQNLSPFSEVTTVKIVNYQIKLAVFIELSWWFSPSLTVLSERMKSQ